MSGKEYQEKLSKDFDFDAGERKLKCLSRATIPCGKFKDPRLSRLFRGIISQSRYTPHLYFFDSEVLSQPQATR